jgi:hypothetical protein
LFHYIDSYQSLFLAKDENIDITMIGRLFVSSGPKWIDSLLIVRNKIVGIFGLKTSGQLPDAQQQLNSYKFEVGEQLNIFKLFERTENELILGENDKHLNFRVSLLLEKLGNGINERKLSLTTTVKYNNLFGRIYFLPVKPIHNIIVKISIKEIIRKLE